ncbi:MAG: hypothetical protein P9X24_06555 [Candidatus Hatepunaea meridiana]|nr:hypothetical protein [Candidatus Hatepunaea meridiana]
MRILLLFSSLIILLSIVNSPAMSDDLRHFPQPRRSGADMSILVSGINGVEIVDSSELAIFTPDSIIAGAVLLNGNPPWGVAAWKDDETTDENDGFKEGDTLRFVLWDPIRASEFPAKVEEVLQGGVLKFRSNGFFVLKLQVNAPLITPQPPEWIEIPDDVEGEEGSLIEFEIKGEDANWDALEICYTSSDIPPSAIFIDRGDGSGSFSWLPSYIEAGVYSVVFTLSDGQFEIERVVRIAIMETAASPEYYTIDGPYPNPFNNSAYLKCTIPDNISYTIDALDIMGKTIASLDKGEGQGEFVTMIDGCELSAGAYIFMLDAGNVRKFITGIILK